MHRRTFLAAVGVGTTTAMAGCLVDGRSVAGDTTVGMTMDSFRPEELTVPPGTTVEFVNTSTHGHTVTATNLPDEADDSEYFATGGFDSEEEAWDGWENEVKGVLSEGEIYEHEFVTPGRYDYICIPHIRAGMKGVIYVDEDAEDAEA
jgi:plastocyanin